MKKVLFTLMAIALGVCAHAQAYVGGTLGLDVIRMHEDGEGSLTQKTFAISPDFGYKLNQNWAIGATLSYAFSKAGDADVDQFCVMPYVRATFARAGIVDFFGELAVGYAHQSSGDEGVSGTVSALRPGMAINFNDNFALLARTNLLRYEYWDGLGIFEFALNNSLELGFRYSF